MGVRTIRDAYPPLVLLCFLSVFFVEHASAVFLKEYNMSDVTEYFNVSSSEKLPQMDLGYLGGRGYDSINELMRAIILRTIEDFNSGGEFRAEALEYLFDDEEEYIFSFNAICRHLGFDPEKTRHSIIHATHRISTRRRAA